MQFVEQNEGSIRSMDEMLLLYVDSLTKDVKAEDSVGEEYNTHPKSEMDIFQVISFFQEAYKRFNSIPEACFIYHKEFYLTANKQINPLLEHKTK